MELAPAFPYHRSAARPTDALSGHSAARSPARVAYRHGAHAGSARKRWLCLPTSLELDRAWSERGGSVAWIAIEDPAHRWPPLGGKSSSAGPFYLVWEHPERSGISSEQWPYAIASLIGGDDPLQRWPQLLVDANVSPGDPARRGQEVFIVQCLPCHRLRGAGTGDLGPDLGQPMPVTVYFTKEGLKALIRDPAAVRSWPQMQMPGFKANMSDLDIDAVIAYLGQITGTAAH